MPEAEQSRTNPQVLTLCHQCSAGRPCTFCVSRNAECRYETEAGESHPRALKRKYEDMGLSHAQYATLFNMMAVRDERTAAEIFSCIRSGHDPAAILAFIETGDAAALQPDA
jgi:hypothetical protein